MLNKQYLRDILDKDSNRGGPRFIHIGDLLHPDIPDTPVLCEPNASPPQRFATPTPSTTDYLYTTQLKPEVRPWHIARLRPENIVSALIRTKQQILTESFTPSLVTVATYRTTVGEYRHMS